MIPVAPRYRSLGAVLTIIGFDYVVVVRR
eukprot:SAG11_NODE_6334_length_1334_cov_1.404858_2_plen_28_part_01